jgi:hypothetical protein
MTKRDSVVMSVRYSFTLHHSDDYFPAPGMLLLASVKLQVGRDTMAPQSPRASARNGTGFVARSELSLIVSRGLRRHYQDVRHAPKLLARAIDVEPETARSYLDEKRIPGACKLLEIMAECREIRTEVNRLVDKLEAANKTAKGFGNEVNRPSNYRSNDAEPRSGIRAEPRLGENQGWSGDYFSVWSRIFLVGLP